MADIQPGTMVKIASDIFDSGALIFAMGEQVSVKQVSPNPQMPQYRYTVHSARTGKWYQLRDEDIVTPSHQSTVYDPSPIVPDHQLRDRPLYAQPMAGSKARAPVRPSAGSANFSTMTTGDWLVGIGGIGLIIAPCFWATSYVTAFPFIGVVLLVLVLLDKVFKVSPIENWSGLSILYIILGGIGTLFGSISLINLINLLTRVHSTILGRWYISPILGLLSDVAVLIGGLMLYQRR